MNPCSATKYSRYVQINTRAVHFVGRSVRISHNPSPNARHSGIPTGISIALATDLSRSRGARLPAILSASHALVHFPPQFA
jgi:hypothetical protein